MYAVHDWAEVHRLHHVEGLSKQAVAVKLGMSRTTVYWLLGLTQPPRYERAPVSSKLDPFVDQIAAMLREDPRVPATVIAERLRPHGYGGSLTILKNHLRRVRPAFLAAVAYQRTSYANPGRHAEVPAFELESSQRFFARHLDGGTRTSTSPTSSRTDVFGVGSPAPPPGLPAAAGRRG